MNNEPRQKLREIVSRYGTKVHEDKPRCKALILDYCSSYRKEVNVILAALDENVPTELFNALNTAGVPTDLLMSRLTQKLCDERGLDKDASRWAVESWALALGIKVTPTRTPAPEEHTTWYAPSPLPSPTPSPPNPLPTRSASPPSQVSHTTSYTPPLSSRPRPPSSTRPIPTSRPAPVTSSRRTTQIPVPPAPATMPVRRTSVQNTQTFGNILLIAFGITIMTFGARTFVYPHVFSQGFSYILLPYSLCFVGVILGRNRGFLASALFLVLGALGIPLFHFNTHPAFSIPGLLNLYLSWGGSSGFRLPYILASPIIVYVVGLFCQSPRKNFLGSLIIMLLGQAMYFLSLAGIEASIIDISLAGALSSLLTHLPDAFLLAFILAIPFHWINVARA